MLIYCVCVCVCVVYVCVSMMCVYVCVYVAWQGSFEVVKPSEAIVVKIVRLLKDLPAH